MIDRSIRLGIRESGKKFRLGTKLAIRFTAIEIKPVGYMMVQIPGSKILNAVEGTSIESFHDDGIVAIVIAHDLLMAMPESPPPCVTVSMDNIVTVKSGNISVARIEAESSVDAGDIATALTELLMVA